MQDVNVEVEVSAPPESVESDPTRRYWRFEKVLGSGACKTVFKAFDSREGIEVAWNKIALGSSSALSQDPTFRRRLFSEIHVLKRLQHKNIITFHDYWLDTRACTLNFITELFTHGSLKRFRSKHKLLELQVLKKWAWQMLQGLVYLHGHEPPIIHRDLKCDNIFINGVTGDLKIGDLGLATLWKGLAPLSVIGTPEFMAPEFYNENYDEKVDVYAFGMLLLELVSMDYPYCECTNPASIYKKVSQGVYPASIQKIRHQELKEFIELCIAFEPEKRPDARQLLKHHFFNSVRKTMEPSEKNLIDIPETEITTTAVSKTHSFASLSEANSSDVASIDINGHLPPSIHSSLDSGSDPILYEAEVDPIQDLSSSNQVHIKIECVKVEDEPILNFTLEYQKPGDTIQTIDFPFNVKEDTAEQIIREMRDESLNEMDLLITEEEASMIGQLIGEEVKKWRLKDEAQFEAYVNVHRRNQTMETSSEIENSVKGSEDDVRLRLEAQVEDMCETMAAGQGSEHYFKALDLHSPAIMDYMDFTLRNPQKHRLSFVEDDPNSQAGLNEDQILFSNPPLLDQDRGANQVEVKTETQDIQGDKGSSSSSAIDIPKIRRISSNFGQSHSMSSTHSESRFQHHLENGESPFGKTVFRRWSGKNFLTTEYQPPSSVGNHVRRSLSLAVDPLTPSTPKQDLTTPEVSTEVALIFLESAQPDAETPVHSSGAGKSQNSGGKIEVTDQDKGKTQINNSSLISLVKVMPSAPVSGTMPTVHELASEETSKSPKCKTKDRKKSKSKKTERKTSAKSKADEYAWRIANQPLVKDTEEGGASRGSTQCSEDSSRSSEKLLESNPTASSADLVPQIADQNTGIEKRKDSWGGSWRHIDLDHHELSESEDHRKPTRPDDHLHKRIGSDDHLSKKAQQKHNGGGGRLRCRNSSVLSLDALDFPSSFATPRDKTHSEYQNNQSESLRSDSIRAFRKQASTGSTTQDPDQGYHQLDEKRLLSLEAQHNLERMFKSCADLSHLLPLNPPPPPASVGTDFDSRELDPVFNDFQEPHRPASFCGKFAQFSHEESGFNSPVATGHRRGLGPHGRGFKKSGSANYFQRVPELSILTARSEQIEKENPEKKKERRRQAEQSIGKMEELHLEGLRKGGSVGVGVRPQRTRRMSMNGSWPSCQ